MVESWLRVSDNLSEHLWIAKEALEQAIAVRHDRQLDITLDYLNKAKKEISLAEDNLRLKKALS